jgi:pimeloyl-ACP methyl ester carboxylesterase
VITDLTRTFSVDDVSLAWDRWGDSADGAVPLFLCHGYSGSSHDWAMVADDLAQHRQVVSVDHRGHGRSQKLGSLDRYSIERIATDLVALLDAEVGPVDLLGHSMGGAVAIRVVLERPDLVRSLILMDTSGWSFRPLDEGVAAMMAAFMAAFDPAGGLPDLSAMAGPEDALITAATPAEWQAIKAEMAAAFDPYAMKALGNDLFNSDLSWVRPRLADVTVPVTVIVGSNDHPFVDQADDLAAAVPSGRVTLIEGAYHSPQLTHRVEWLAAVESHLSTSSSRT